jgi:hypothetical protein
VLLGQDGADEPDDRVAVGEDADDVGAAADLAGLLHGSVTSELSG